MKSRRHPFVPKSKHSLPLAIPTLTGGDPIDTVGEAASWTSRPAAVGGVVPRRFGWPHAEGTLRPAFLRGDDDVMVASSGGFSCTLPMIPAFRRAANDCWDGLDERPSAGGGVNTLKKSSCEIASAIEMTAEE